MKILIVVATEAEVSLLLIRFEKGINKGALTHYRYGNLEIDVLVTGIGIAFTVYNLTKCLIANKYDLVINAGIAGCYTDRFSIGSVVNVTEEQFSDLGAEDHDNFLSLFDMGWLKSNHFPFSENVLKNTTEYDNPVALQIARAKGVTANTAHGRAWSIEMIKTKFNPDVETMEGAAVFFVCLSEGVPFIELRAISNKVEPRDLKKWNRQAAIDNLSGTLDDILMYYKSTLR